jgi:hypothetical protein
MNNKNPTKTSEVNTGGIESSCFFKTPVKLFSAIEKENNLLKGILRFPPPMKLTATIITEILLKVALNTINQP